MSVAESRDGAQSPDIPRRYFASLLRWYWPFLRPHRLVVIGACVSAGLVLAAQVLVPLIVANILTGDDSLGPLLLLAAVMILEIITFSLSDTFAIKAATRGAATLREAVFAALLSARNLNRPGLLRASVVSRHTDDVDIVSSAVMRTITVGLPSAALVGLSLLLLMYVDPRSGAAMTAVVLGFLIARARVGKRMLAVDKARLDISSATGDMVDGTVSATRTIAGMRWETWLRSVFERRSHALQEATREQFAVASTLASVGQISGLAGLFIVIVSAAVLGEQQVAVVAAALLYIMNIVTGLGRLPGWVRELQLAVVARRRIDHILRSTQEGSAVERALSEPAWRSLADGFDLDGRLIGLVTAADLDPQTMLTALSGTADQQAWRETLLGEVVRVEGVRPDVVLVPADAELLNLTVREHFHAIDPDITQDRIAQALTAVGLQHVLDRPGGIDTALGPGGAHMPASDRTRLLIAMATVSTATTVLLGPSPLLADPDTAAPLLTVLRANGATVVVCLRSPEVAAAMDRVIHVTAQQIETGDHTGLLTTSSEYSRLWSKRLLGDVVDLTSLGVDDQTSDDLHERLVSERFSAGEVIYRQGDPADRMLFIISGKVAIEVADGDGVRQVAILGPGNHCGDLRLTGHEQRAESAIALQECVIRSLSREAYASGVMGLLNRPVLQRRVLVEILRNEVSGADELVDRMPMAEAALVRAAVDALLRDGVVRESEGRLRLVHRRRVRIGMQGIHDRLQDL